MGFKLGMSLGILPKVNEIARLFTSKPSYQRTLVFSTHFYFDSFRVNRNYHSYSFLHFRYVTASISVKEDAQSIPCFVQYIHPINGIGKSFNRSICLSETFLVQLSIGT